ncbi:glycoside hydrolase family 97 protein [Barnesiella sp. WM24]|uniref:glycoside hydrolase family 97 protein n=1 Tax=Barnesiella sp. WM24 TaxID=2558278 RepID=UPI001FD7EB84|nr:glycoside hydrolase family 97 protein [Barnesiella sp. WM24]
MIKNILTSVFIMSGAALSAQQSPGDRIRVSAEGDTALVVTGNAGGEWRKVLTLECGKITGVVDRGIHDVDYTMITGKRKRCHNRYRESGYLLESGDTVNVRVSDDGVAWSGCHGYGIDVAGFSHSWLMKWTDCYEGFYERDREDLSEGMRIGYPALFEYGDKELFMLLSESGVDENSAASSLYAVDGAGLFDIRPDGEESSGWQTAIIGTLPGVVGSTLVNDNAQPSRIHDTSWIAPGVASWVYWAYNHGSNDYDIICRYVDMACEMNLPYVLIDAEWDEMKDGKSVLDAVAYAHEKGVKPMIWYNSSIGWVDGAPGPKFRLNTPEDREREFAWCQVNGIAGVKIDFFSGDDNRNLRYMTELLECAARHNLLVNFHGATIPRGQQRTYPNLVSVEAVYGAEWYNNVPTFTDRAASHNATLPFTRNVIGSMDYTPCAFTDSQHPHVTTDAHELALTVMYESGIQHLADRPESFLSQPAVIRDFLTALPTAWDDTVLLGGYPGEYAVIARRKADLWYVAGINGSDSRREVRIDMSLLPEANEEAAVLITDSDGGWSVLSDTSVPSVISLLPRGGFVMTVRSGVTVDDACGR